MIPSLVWGEADTYWFSFDGIDEGSIVAVSTIGMRTEKTLFMAGYKEMLRRLKPKAVICYGDPFDEMDGELIPVDYAQTNNLTQGKNLIKPFIKYFRGCIIKGGGTAGGSGGSGESRSIPDFPGWDPSKCPGKGYEWRGRGEPGSKTGNWYNPQTHEWLRGDLNHADPIGPHWDYGIRGANISYRIFPDNSYAPKSFHQEGAVLK